MASQPPSTSAGASSSSSPALDSAAHRSCSKCSRRMSSYKYDKHTLCLHCRDVLCSVDLRCRECSSWSTEMMQDYLKHQKSLVSKGKKKSSVTTPTSSAPSVLPSATPASPAVSDSVAPPTPTLTSLASDQSIKDYVHSVLASFFSQPASQFRLGNNPFVSAPMAEVPNVSQRGSTGGSDADSLLRGRQVAPSGMVPWPQEDDVISSPILSVSVASGSSVSVPGPLPPSSWTVASAPSLSAPALLPGFSSVASPPSSSFGDFSECQARVLGLSAGYQVLGRWFVASGGFRFEFPCVPFCSLPSSLF